MSLQGIADNEQLAALTKILDDYCLDKGIVDHDEARNRAARRIMALFNQGIEVPEEIVQAINDGTAARLL